MKVLSLFDGMACGMIAMQLAGVEVESYDAYEIDKYAIKTAQHNFPMIKEHGDVFEADFTQYEGVDFLIGGSPCTYWSIAQTKNRETVASGMGWELFSQYVRALHEAKPKYFIYENNKSMSKQIRASIDEAFGFEAVLINSALVSAQNRQRLYWVGKRNEDGTYSKVNVEQPADRGILLKDVLDNAVYAKSLTDKEMDYMVRDHQDRRWNFCNRPGEKDKSECITANIHKGVPYNVVAEPVCVAERGRMYCGQPQHYEARTDGKTNTLTSVEKDNRVAEPVAVNLQVLGRKRNSNGEFERYYEARTDSKASTITSVEGRRMVAEPINVTANGKAQCLRAACYKDGIRNIIANEVDKKTGVAEPINVTADGKSQTIKAQYANSSLVNFCCYTSTYGATGVAESINDIRQVGAMPRPDGEISTSAGFRIYSTEAKGRYLCANGGGAGAKTGLYAVPYDCDVVITENSIRCQRRDQKHSTVQGSHVNFTDGKTQTLSPSHIPNVIEGKSGKEITIYEVRDGKITIKGKQYPIKLKDGFYIIRKLTVSECKRLQTVPEWYEFPVSNSQAYKMLGNGWTCEVICHLINSCFKPADVIPGQIEMEGFDG